MESGGSTQNLIFHHASLSVSQHSLYEDPSNPLSCELDICTIALPHPSHFMFGSGSIRRLGLTKSIHLDNVMQNSMQNTLGLDDEAREMSSFFPTYKLAKAGYSGEECSYWVGIKINSLMMKGKVDTLDTRGNRFLPDNSTSL